MPEGHSVHRIAKQFQENFVGSTPEITSPQGRFAADALLVSHQKMVSAEAVGKQLFLGFENELWMRVHLGIYGAWDFSGDVRVHPQIMVHGPKSVDLDAEDSTHSIGAPRKTRLKMAEEDRETNLDVDFPPQPVGQVRARILNGSVCADLRGPTVCEVITLTEKHAVLDRLGPDPANNNSDEERERFVSRAAKKRGAIAQVLMDQNVIAGIGNVYRAEMLFRAKINPHTPANQLTQEQLNELWRDWVHLLDDGIRVGQMITIDGLQGKDYERALKNRDDRHYVYRLNGQPCKVCGTNIALEEMAARKLYWCPNCQS